MSDLRPGFENIERKADGMLTKVVGGVMLWIGIAFVALFAWMSYRLTMLGRTPEYLAFVFLGAFALLATFCSLVGWRMFFNRPNRFGSILSPIGWRMLGGIFGALGIAFGILAAALPRDFAPGDVLLMTVATVAFCAVFCYSCLLAARQAQANARQVP